MTEPRYRDLMGRLHPDPQVRRAGGRNGGNTATIARWAASTGLVYDDGGNGDVPGWVRDAYATANPTKRPGRPPPRVPCPTGGRAVTAPVA